MMFLLALKWFAIAVVVVLCALLAAGTAIALAILCESGLYHLRRYRAQRALIRVHALKKNFASAIAVPSMNNPLMRGLSIPLGRFEKAVETLDRRTASLEDDNVARRGPHTRSEWRRLRKDVQTVLRRGKQLLYFIEAPDARDGVWPFVDDYSKIYADENYAEQATERNSVPASAQNYSQRRHRNWGVGRGALDEDVMPSQEERRQAQVANLRDEPKIALLQPAARQNADVVCIGTYDKTGKVIPFRRPVTVNKKA